MITRSRPLTGFKCLPILVAFLVASSKVAMPAPTAAAGEGLEGLLNAAAAFESTSSRESLLELEKVVAESATNPDLRQALARQMTARLSSPATLEGKKFFCWQLSIVGSDEQVPAIAALLRDPSLFYYARLALERIPGDKSLTALQRALSETTGPERVGVINSLAVRSDARVVPDLATVARGNDVAAAAAAIKALGQLGGAEACRVLVGLESAIPAPLALELDQAQLLCAASLVALGKQEDATPIFERLFTSGQLPALRAAAFQLWTLARGDDAAPRVLSALKGEDAVIQRAALEALKDADVAVITSAARDLGGLAPEMQISLLAILAERHTISALPEIVGLLAGQNALVRMAAIGALGALGDGSMVKPLTSLLTTANAAERSAIASALASLPGKGVEEPLLGALNGGAPEIQIAAIKALRARASKQAIPAFVGAATSANSEVRREALRALGQMADASSCPALIKMLGQASPQDVSEIESALAEICRRTADVSPLVRALPDSPVAGKVALLNALAAVGGAEGLAAIQEELQSRDAELRIAALRLLAEWPNSAPLDSLGSVALSSADARARVLALRGLARLAPLAKDAQAREASEWIGRAMPRASVNEQRLLLAALGLMPNPASLKVAASYLADPALAGEARTTAYKILDSLDNARRADVAPFVQQLKSSTTNADETARLEWYDVKFGDWQKLSAGATATNPDGLKADGEGGPPSAAIDGNEKTYWDEEDNQKLYILRVHLKQAASIAYLRIMGWQQHNFAPRDFEILGDGKLLKRIDGAQYTKNWLQVPLAGNVCRSLELRITGFYGASPAIRELEIYGKPGDL